MSGEKELLIRFHREVLGREDLGWRNDCAAIQLHDDLALVYSVDRPAFIRGRSGEDALHYHGRWSSAVIANDVIASGVRPRGISFDVGMADLSDDDFVNFGHGVVDTCRRYGMTYDGGNLATGADISGVSWGTGHPGHIIRRRGARPGAAIVVTTAVGIGWARRVWRHLIAGSALPEQLTRYQDEPWVNIEAFEKIWILQAIQAGMDLTDGVTEFGYEIAEQSGLGVIFEPVGQQADVVRDTAERAGLPAEAFWFEPGYDTPYAHGWCVDAAAVSSVLEILHKHGVPACVVGRTTTDVEGVVAVRKDGERVHLPRYWDDALRERGSIDAWMEQIVRLFV
jgi:thiamine monophosphate kinase